jgi:hypothetical protein
VPISNELFVFDLQPHTDCGQMVGYTEVVQVRPSPQSPVQDLSTAYSGKKGRRHAKRQPWQRATEAELGCLVLPMVGVGSNRHEDTPSNHYTQAVTAAKRTAHTAVVSLIVGNGE